MSRHFNLARVATATTGTGTITLGSPVGGFLSFADAGVPDGALVSYAISDGANSEAGRGIYSTSGPTLTRGPITSTNSNNAISLTGAAIVFITAIAQDFDVGPMPQGRLTLTTATPVLTADTTAQTTVFYTPYVGNSLPIYNGSRWAWHQFSEMSQATTDTTKSPAAVTTNSNYDVFAWMDAGTLRATRGPAWSSSTARGTGAGTTELVRAGGMLLNANAITNGPAAQRGTYLGTIRTNGSSQVDWRYGATAAGGTAGSFGVFNAYNRVRVSSISRDSTDSWTYSTASWRRSNNSAGMACNLIQGLNDMAIDAMFSTRAQPSSATNAMVGIGVGSTSAFSGVSGAAGRSLTENMFDQAMAFWSGTSLGWVEVNALETATAASAATFYGDAGDVTFYTNGLITSAWM